MRFHTQMSLWRVLIPVGIGTGLSLMGDSALYTILPTHTADAGVALAGVGILLSANRWVRLATNGAAGWISDRWPRRRVFVPALFLGAISTMFYALVPGFALFLLGRLLWGIAWSGIWVAGNAIILDITGNDNRGRWVSYYQVSFFMGTAAGAILGGLLTDWIGYQGAMWIAAGLNLTGTAAAWLLLPETGHLRREQKGEPVVSPPLSPPRRTAELTSATLLMGIHRIVIAGILISTFSLFLLDLLGESVTVGRWSVGVATLTGLGLGTTTLLGMAAMPVIGRLSDRAGNRWQVVSGGLAAGVAGFGLLALGIPLAILLGLPLTSVSSSNQGLSTALVGDLSGNRQRGRSLGILFTVGDLGSAIGPPLAYGLLPLWGIRGIYWFCAALLGGMLFVALWWGGKRPFTLSASRKSV